MKDLSTFVFLGLIAALIACQPQKQTSDLTGNVGQPVPLYTDDLPSTWTMLSDQNGEMIIFHPCDANNTMVEIRYDTLYINWGQEEGFYKITSLWRDQDKIFFNAKSDYGEQEDQFSVEFLDAERKKARWFVWLNDSTSAVFADARTAADYKTVKQPCLECWGEDVCNEKVDSLDSQ
jgi:hypothetical protein